MSPVISAIEWRFSQLDIDGSKIYVRDYTDDNDVKVLIYARITYDPVFSRNYLKKVTAEKYASH